MSPNRLPPETTENGRIALRKLETMERTGHQWKDMYITCSNGRNGSNGQRWEVFGNNDTHWSSMVVDDNRLSPLEAVGAVGTREQWKRRAISHRQLAQFAAGVVAA